MVEPVIPPIADGPDPKIVLPTKPVVGPHIGVVTVTEQPSLIQRIKAIFNKGKP